MIKIKIRSNENFFFLSFGAIQEKLARMNAEQYASEAVAYLVAMAMDNKTENYHLEAACGKEMLETMVIKNILENYNTFSRK